MTVPFTWNRESVEWMLWNYQGRNAERNMPVTITVFGKLFATTYSCTNLDITRTLVHAFYYWLWKRFLPSHPVVVLTRCQQKLQRSAWEAYNAWDIVVSSSVSASPSSRWSRAPRNSLTAVGSLWIILELWFRNLSVLCTSHKKDTIPQAFGQLTTL